MQSIIKRLCNLNIARVFFNIILVCFTVQQLFERGLKFEGYI